ncbi:3'-5' exonuclease, partial [uncultured Caulobacter sp.]|uniref:3'-5' exonuclease n=1 Tax=uncultured Caulobacter sp. TaxID=158749 RepID=UPI00262A77C0
MLPKAISARRFADGHPELGIDGHGLRGAVKRVGTFPVNGKGSEFADGFEPGGATANIVGVEDGNLPHEASIEEGRLDEERRLMYVGITRAKEQLWLSHANEAQRWGDRMRLK